MRKERYFVLILSSDFYALKIIQKDFISLLFKTNLRKIKDDTYYYSYTYYSEYWQI